MNVELELELRKKYPELLTELLWGIQCNNGWFWLLNNLCSQLQWDIDRNKEPQMRITTIKEKFGTLRVYTTGSSERQNGTIALAELMSASMCEECGSIERVSQTTGYITTLCQECLENIDEK